MRSARSRKRSSSIRPTSAPRSISGRSTPSSGNTRRRSRFCARRSQPSRTTRPQPTVWRWRSRDPATRSGPAAMQRFETLRGTPYARTYSQTYLEQGQYAEALASTGAEAGPGRRGTAGGHVRGRHGGRASRIPTAARHRLRGQRRPHRHRQRRRSRHPRERRRRVAPVSKYLRIVCRRSGSRWPRDARQWTGVDCGRGRLRQRRPRRSLRRTASGHRLLHQRRNGTFEDRARARTASVPASVGVGRLRRRRSRRRSRSLHCRRIASGERRRGPLNQLLRNNGNGTFTDITSDAKVGGGTARGDRDRADRLRQPPRHRPAAGQLATGAPLLFQNMRDGSFRDVAADAGLPGAGTYSAVAAGDVNKDGYHRFLLRPGGRAGRLRAERRPRPLRHGDAPPESSQCGGGAVRRLRQRRPARSLRRSRRQCAAVFRNLGSAWADMTDRAGLQAGAFSRPARAASSPLAAGDLDGDGDDRHRRASDDRRGLRVWRNDGGSRLHSLRVRLRPASATAPASGAKIDLRAGSLRQRLETSAAVAGSRRPPTSCSASARARPPTSSACCGRRASLQAEVTAGARRPQASPPARHDRPSSIASPRRARFSTPGTATASSS